MGYYLKNRQLQTGGPGVVAGNVLTGNVSITKSGDITAVGNITGNYYYGNGTYLTGIGNIQNGSSNVTVVSPGGNVTIGIGGTPNVAVFTVDGEYIKGIISASGTVTSGNLLTSGQISAAGNIAANPSSYFIGNGSLLTGITAVTSGFPVSAGTSNIAANTDGNVGVTVGGTSNVLTIANTGIYTTGLASVSGNITAGNVTANGNITVGNISAAGQAAIGNLILASNTINTTNNTVALFLGSLGVGLPSGNVAERPVSPPIGTSRLNTDYSQLETWDGTRWLIIGPPTGNTITDQQFSGDGNTTTYILSEPATASSLLVSIQGVGQIPRTSYTVSGNVLTFNQAPAIGDNIDVRLLSASVGHDIIYNSYGNSFIQTTDAPGVIMSVNSSNAVVIGSDLSLDIRLSSGARLPVYTVAQTAGITNPTVGQMIYVSNGDSGNPCLGVYQNGAWKRVLIAAANISAT